MRLEATQIPKENRDENLPCNTYRLESAGLLRASAFAGTSNPEQFSYTLSNAGYEDWHLTTADGWSANWAGTVNPPSTGSQVIVTGTGQELQMDNGYIGSNIIWWQQPVLPEASDPVQTFRYDVKHNRVYDGPNTRSLVGTQGEQGSDYTFISWFDLRPTQNQMGWTVPESPELIWEDGKLDTWYTVEVEFQYGTAFDPARQNARTRSGMPRLGTIGLPLTVCRTPRAKYSDSWSTIV